MKNYLFIAKSAKSGRTVEYMDLRLPNDKAAKRELNFNNKVFNTTTAKRKTKIYWTLFNE